MITVAGALLGIALVRWAGQREAWLRAAILAQIADLVTFAAIWEHSQGERNPLSRLVQDVAQLLVPHDVGLDVAIVAIVLAGLKVGLMALLVRINPLLARYRRFVLAVAIAAGALGATSNVVAHPGAGGLLVVLALFAVVAISSPDRFRDALGLSVRFSAAVLLGIGGFTADSYLQFAAKGYACAALSCSALFAPFLLGLAIALYGGAMLATWATLLAAARLLPRRVAHAD